MTERDPALEPFEALIGTWDTEAKHRLVDAVVRGSITFEWLEGGHFLVQRAHNDHELFPDAICLIGAPEHGDGLVMEYFDSRGVRRTYRVSLDDGVWRIWRDQPGFDQRFSATLRRDSFEGVAQLAETPGDWQDDMQVTYRRRAQAAGRLVPDRAGAESRSTGVVLRLTASSRRGAGGPAAARSARAGQGRSPAAYRARTAR